MLLALAAVGSIAFLAHNAWYMHQKVQDQHERIRDLEQKVNAPAK